MGHNGTKNFLEAKEVVSAWALLVEAKAGVSGQESSPEALVRSLKFFLSSRWGGRWSYTLPSSPACMLLKAKRPFPSLLTGPYESLSGFPKDSMEDDSVIYFSNCTGARPAWIFLSLPKENKTLLTNVSRQYLYPVKQTGQFL